MSRVRIVARDEDGGRCVVIFPAPREPAGPLSDEEHFAKVTGEVMAADPELRDKPHLDMDLDDLPPLDKQANWKLAYGKLIDAPRS